MLAGVMPSLYKALVVVFGWPDTVTEYQATVGGRACALWQGGHWVTRQPGRVRERHGSSSTEDTSF